MSSSTMSGASLGEAPDRAANAGGLLARVRPRASVRTATVRRPVAGLVLPMLLFGLGAAALFLSLHSRVHGSSGVEHHGLGALAIVLPVLAARLADRCHSTEGSDSR